VGRGVKTVGRGILIVPEVGRGPKIVDVVPVRNP
jgi:hypothetical protein